jgi:hypothetical protein
VTTTTPKYMAVQGAALLVATGFLVIGILGFIPGVTTDYGLLDWTGHHSGAKLFGVFAVAGVHNVMHLAFGVVGMILTRSYAAARAYLIGGGLAYLALWVIGLFIDGSDLVPLNGASNLLHYAIGGVMVILGLTLGGQRDPTKRRQRRRSPKSAPGL